MHTDKNEHDWSAIPTHRDCRVQAARTLALQSGSLLSRSIRVHLWFLVVLGCCTLSFAQSAVRDYRRAHERPIIDEFTRLLAIPNVASDRENLRRTAQFIV